jgi:antirestriction protein ArdC
MTVYKHSLSHVSSAFLRKDRHFRSHAESIELFDHYAYACEEARVEMATVFVCNMLNLPTDFENHAAYVTNWLKKIREDKRELLSCAADAQRIAEYTLAFYPDFKSAQPVRPTDTGAERIEELTLG